VTLRQWSSARGTITRARVWLTLGEAAARVLAATEVVWDGRDGGVIGV